MSGGRSTEGRAQRVRRGFAALGGVIAVTMSACTVPVPVPTPPPMVAGPSSGCGTTQRGAVTDQRETINVDGDTRAYTITIPPAHTPGTTRAIPLVFDFHGLIEGAVGTHPFATQFSAKAAANGFAVVDPVGSGDGMYWDVALDNTGNRDLHFVDALLAKLESTMCIDRSSVYITGLSYGAAMTSMLMCMRPNTFAAAAPVAGIQNRCTSAQRSVPFVTFHGTADPILPYPFFGDTPGQIAAKYGCAGPPAEAVLSPNPDPATGGAITKLAWDCRAAGTDAVFYKIDGGGHTWPGSVFFGWVAFIVGPTTTSLNATDVIWDFFAAHHLPAAAS